MGKFQPRPSSLARTVGPYAPPPFEAPVSLRLDANEGAAPGPRIARALAKIPVESLSQYPSTAPVEEELAGRLGIERGRIIATAGADDALERVMRALLCEGRNIVLPVPTFEMIERYAVMAGGEVRGIPWLQGALPVEEMIARVDADTAVVCVVTPNSPTGLWAVVQDLERLSAAAPEALLLVDLAYTEFAEEDLTRTVISLPNGLAVRTMSKAWGLAGLRVGYAAGPESVISWMRALGHPYAVSSLSIALALGLLKTGEQEVREATAQVRVRRERMTDLLRRLGLECGPSRGNFVLARTDRAAEVRNELAARGVAVRAFPGKPLLEGCLRISVPTCAEDMERFEFAIEAVARTTGGRRGD